MRTLYLVPIIHSGVEMLRGSRKDFAKLPEVGRTSYSNFVNSYWDKVEPKLKGYAVRRVYLDGWTGGSWDYITQHAQEGSRVSKAVLDFIMKDVPLEVTEEEGLIIAQHKAYEELTSRGRLTVADVDKVLFPLTMARDLFIRRNVRATLKDGEAGILFLGLHHIIPNYKDVDIVEVYPREQLKQELRGLPLGNILADDMERFELFYQQAVAKGLIEQLEDYVDNPGKYGYDYPI